MWDILARESVDKVVSTHKHHNNTSFGIQKRQASAARLVECSHSTFKAPQQKKASLKFFHNRRRLFPQN